MSAERASGRLLSMGRIHAINGGHVDGYTRPSLRKAYITAVVLPRTSIRSLDNPLGFVLPEETDPDWAREAEGLFKIHRYDYVKRLVKGEHPELVDIDVASNYLDKLTAADPNVETGKFLEGFDEFVRKRITRTRSNSASTEAMKRYYTGVEDQMWSVRELIFLLQEQINTSPKGASVENQPPIASVTNLLTSGMSATQKEQAVTVLNIALEDTAAAALGTIIGGPSMDSDDWLLDLAQTTPPDVLAAGLQAGVIEFEEGVLGDIERRRLLFTSVEAAMASGIADEGLLARLTQARSMVAPAKYSQGTIHGH